MREKERACRNTSELYCTLQMKIGIARSYYKFGADDGGGSDARISSSF